MNTRGRREIAAGLIVVGLSMIPTGRRRPPAWELDAFRTVNELPDDLYRPVWVVMQFGALAAAPATAAVALATGQRALARRLLIQGAGAWLAAKGLKRVVRRERPEAFVDDVHIRGKSQTGGGFPSGHAGVATALAGATLLSTDPAIKPVVTTVALAVAAGRVYVGAHLPLDVVGGVGLGLLVDGARRAIWST